jgi:hypothetical protein
VDPKVVLKFEKNITFLARSVQFPDAPSPVLLNFILWRLIFVGREYVT